ncbi:universal stress protein UspA [Nesterenkonia sp. AN1]|uniref:Nucleotide-binding universal stress UspA family protein n=1 Tax=Nesterenkonia aurantiaca TaxID=1436010 RepID=A0A4R7G5V3_9MICC|nr:MULTISPECIES: universal stress protein [Nesterenkonia]EXF24860.1 universal stress protein UspA [Nesterenkonia sp. AN1]TDS86789.1 nucleotide-binding universal stress UspA family protein [Nesterenkonia aurantiaca]
MTGPIIVGVDGSPTAQRAAHKARDLALKLDVALHVVSAHTDATIEHVNSGSDQWVVSGADNALYIAEQVVRGLRTPGLKIHAGSAQGKPAEALIDYAEKAGAQLIVVGNQRMRGARRVLGSVANTVSHTAGCDVYIANTYVD